MKSLHSKKTIQISVIVPTRNAGTTILHTLKSLAMQSQPIKEIVVVDNASTDNTIEILQRYGKKIKIPIIIITNATNKGVGHSYNIGVKKAKSEFVVFIHSDSSLPTATQLTKLIDPFHHDSAVIATYSSILMPEKNWIQYSFWMRCLFARAVGKESPGLNGKFDCIKKHAFIQIGGFDTHHFAGDKGIGGEDADLHERLRKMGRVVQSEAKVVHLHYLGANYSLTAYIQNRKLLARSYGRYLRVHGLTSALGLALLVKPLLAFIPLIPGFLIPGFLILLTYSLCNSYKIYTHKSSWVDMRIFLLPFVDVFLIYYESFWMAESFVRADIKK
jgi:glycosyltransferase involved in cell wall biosynthesis